MSTQTTHSAKLEGPSQFRAAEVGAAGRRRCVFFACDKEAKAAKLAGAARVRIGNDLGVCKTDGFEFCWIVDFPMYEWNEDEKKIDFSHNPFSMPQGGLEALLSQGPAHDQGVPVRHRLQRD